MNRPLNAELTVNQRKLRLIIYYNLIGEARNVGVVKPISLSWDLVESSMQSSRCRSADSLRQTRRSHVLPLTAAERLKSLQSERLQSERQESAMRDYLDTWARNRWQRTHLGTYLQDYKEAADKFPSHLRAWRVTTHDGDPQRLSPNTEKSIRSVLLHPELRPRVDLVKWLGTLGGKHDFKNPCSRGLLKLTASSCAGSGSLDSVCEASGGAFWSDRVVRHGGEYIDVEITSGISVHLTHVAFRSPPALRRRPRSAGNLVADSLLAPDVPRAWKVLIPGSQALLSRGNVRWIEVGEATKEERECGELEELLFTVSWRDDAGIDTIGRHHSTYRLQCVCDLEAPTNTFDGMIAMSSIELFGDIHMKEGVFDAQHFTGSKACVNTDTLGLTSAHPETKSIYLSAQQNDEKKPTERQPVTQVTAQKQKMSPPKKKPEKKKAGKKNKKQASTSGERKSNTPCVVNKEPIIEPLFELESEHRRKIEGEVSIICSRFQEEGFSEAVSKDAIFRALHIPEDRPIHVCMKGLPLRRRLLDDPAGPPPVQRKANDGRRKKGAKKKGKASRSKGKA